MSNGCIHHRSVEPILEKVDGMVEPTETICRANVAVGRELADNDGVGGTPILLMFLNGREVGRAGGPRPELSTVFSAVTGPFG